MDNDTKLAVLLTVVAVGINVSIDYLLFVI
jgi:hypothetical protein